MAYFTASTDDAETNKKFAESLSADYPILAYNLKQGNFAEVRLVDSYKPVTVGTVAIGIRKSDTELLAKINTSLAKLKSNGSIAKMLEKWGQKADAS